MLSFYFGTEPGTFQFTSPSLLLKETLGKVYIPISRVNGVNGKVDVKWKIAYMTGKHQPDEEGFLTFEHGENAKILEIPIHNNQVFIK